MIVKAALLLFREVDNYKEILFVRARHKRYFVFPGGKKEENETIEEALVRELQEELQVKVIDIQNIGSVDGATPDNNPLRMHLYTGKIIGEPKPSSEIEEIAWMTKKLALQDKARMTPMTLDHVFPFLDNHKLW